MKRTGKASSSSAAEAPAAEMMTKKRKKKGRPSLVEIQKRNLLKQQLQEKALISSPSTPDFNHRTSPELGDDDDERKQKKVKLVVRLPQSNHQLDNLALNSASFNSGSNDDADNPETSAAFDRSGDDLLTDQGKKVLKVTDTPDGSQLESGPTTPLPDKKLLVFILDRLQKKDTRGVFSEPVDPNELPDYHEVIEHPMDFGTVRRKLNTGLYSNLEELEADVFLICSNGMQYNSSDTVYFRQARAIKDLAKRDFENLRHEGDDGELQPKVVRRGRPPGKQQKKPNDNSSADRFGPALSSGATLATGEDNTNGSGAYNLRKTHVMPKFWSADTTLTSQRPRNGENYSECSADWNNEFPASILRADMKYGKKHFSIDETRRDTYTQFYPSGQEPSVFSGLGGDAKQSMPVGLHFEHSYARSLARFAGDLGPVAWKVASRKLESVLPPGIKFGPGFVGENEASPQPLFFSFEKQKTSHNLVSDGHLATPLTPFAAGVNSETLPSFQGKDSTNGMYSRSISQELLPVRNIATFSGIRPELMVHNQQNPVFNSDVSRLCGVLRHNIPSRIGLAREHILTGQSSPRGTSVHSHTPSPGGNSVHSHTPVSLPPSDVTSTSSILRNIIGSEDPDDSNSLRTFNSDSLVAPDTVFSQTIPEAGSSSRQPWQASFPHHKSYSLSIQPDLNVQLQGQGSPSSRLIVGSPQQPDLVLQL